jgi:dihydrofolate reductase
MSRLINSTYISLDGAVEEPHTWPSGRHEDDGGAGRVQSELLAGCEAVLMGRRTYEGFAPVWPTRSDPFSDRMNSLEKLVASTTLRDPEWNNTTVIGADLVGEIARRKETSDGDIVQYGFGEVSRQLLAAGLLDELRLWIHPLLVGKGGPGDLLFRDGTAAQFELADVERLASGIVVLSYTTA